MSQRSVVKLLMLGCTLLSLSGEAAAQSIFLGRNKASWRQQLDYAKDARERRSAVFALGKLGGPNEVSPLVEVLKKDADAKVREAAAFALGEIGNEDSRGIAALQNALKDPDAYVRRSAAVALGSIGTAARGAANALEQALGDGDPNVKQNAAWALGRIGADNVEAYERALRDPDQLVKRDAANSLAMLDASKARPALPALLECCESGNSEVRKSALVVLAKAVNDKDTSAIPTLQRMLDDKDSDVRINAALALANIGGDDAARAALPTLSSALKEGDIGLRRQAAAVLRNFGEAAASAVPMLRDTLREPDEELRGNACVALGGIGAKASSAIPDLVERIANNKEAAKVRTEAANALSRMGTPAAAVAAVPRLTTVLGDTSVPGRVRERILWALRVHNVELRNLKVFPTFEKILHEPQQKDAKMLRYDSAYMLGMLQGEDCSKKTVEVLHEWLLDGSIQIYTGTSVSGTRTVKEDKKEGGANVTERGSSDGRIMVVQALEQIGVQKALAMHPPIRAQLQVLATTNNLDPDLKAGVQKLIKGMR